MDKENELKCPNCGKNLVFCGRTTYDGDDNYDKYTCDNCSHVIVLDWRNED